LFVGYVLFLDLFGEIDSHEGQFLDASYHFETRNFFTKIIFFVLHSLCVFLWLW